MLRNAREVKFCSAVRFTAGGLFLSEEIPWIITNTHPGHCDEYFSGSSVVNTRNISWHLQLPFPVIEVVYAHRQSLPGVTYGSYMREKNAHGIQPEKHFSICLFALNACPVFQDCVLFFWRDNGSAEAPFTDIFKVSIQNGCLPWGRPTKRSLNDDGCSTFSLETFIEISLCYRRYMIWRVSKSFIKEVLTN